MEKHYTDYLKKLHKTFKEMGDLNEAALDVKNKSNLLIFLGKHIHLRKSYVQY